MGKTLCDLKKELKHDLDAYIQLVCLPRFVCTKCGRVANAKKLVCHPHKIAEVGVTLPEHAREIAWVAADA
jgi:hypothetical protein